MNNDTSLLIVSGVAGALLGVAAVLSFLDGAALSGTLQAAGAAFLVASGIVINHQRQGGSHVDS